MVVGLGVDILDVDRVEAKLCARDAAFFAEIFTPAEIADCEAADRRAPSYARRFAAKEALLKALATPGAPLPFPWRDIVVRRGPAGRLDLVLGGRARALAEARGVARTWLSTAVAGGVALASVVLESEP